MEADSLATESELRTLSEDKIRAEGEKKRLLMQISDAEAAGTEAETQREILGKAIKENEVYKHECTAAVCSRNVGEFPNVSYTDSAACTNEYETEI